MEALEVGEPRVVACVHERLVARLDELADPSAEHRLLAEEVCLGLLSEGRLDHAAACAADALRIGEHEVAGVAAGVLVDRREPGHTVAFDELAPDEVPGPLRGHQAYVDLGPRVDLAVVDREAVSEEKEVAGGDPVADLGLPDVVLALVGQEDHRDVAGARRVRRRLDAQALRTRLLDRLGIGPQAHQDVYPGVAQVEGVRVPLGAVADDGDGLPVELREVCVLVVDHAAGGYRAALRLRPCRSAATAGERIPTGRASARTAGSPSPRPPRATGRAKS